MSWVSALPMCQEMSMVMATEAYEINKSKTGHPVYSSNLKAVETTLVQLILEAYTTLLLPPPSYKVT